MRAFFSMAGLILGLAVAGKYYAVLSSMIPFVSQGTAAKVVAFIVIVLIILLVAALLAWIIRSIVHAIMLGWVDHLGGAVFGFLVGAYFLAGLLAFVMRFSLLGLAETIKNSGIAQWLLSLPFISSLVASPSLPQLY